MFFRFVWNVTQLFELWVVLLVQLGELRYGCSATDAAQLGELRYPYRLTRKSACALCAIKPSISHRREQYSPTSALASSVNTRW